MRSKLSCILVLGFLCAVLLAGVECARPDGLLSRMQQAARRDKGSIWALIIAGSAGWGNYRHQADVCHSYQLLKHGGVDPDQIIVMMADDIAGNFLNPHQGQIFNAPGGKDVYEGVPKHYTGSEVNAANFLDVLAGNEEAVEKRNGHKKKVLKSGPNDHVFVYYADHGAPGILGMPSGAFLYADQLMDTLKNKSRNNEFKEMVMYIEACESGSMFEGLLDDSLDIYVTTAANAYESSWGTYCPGMTPPPPPEFTTCLGDLYSVAWMEDSERNDLNCETLEEQYLSVKKRTSNNFTYSMGSHVMQYGDMKIDEEPVAEYQGKENTGDASISGPLPVVGSNAMTAVPQREADLLHLWTVYQRATGQAKVSAGEALHAELSRRTRVDKAVRSAVACMLAEHGLSTLLQEKYDGALDLSAVHVLPQNSADSPTCKAPGLLAHTPLVEAIVTQPLPRAEGKAVVDDWNCLRGMVNAWEAECGTLDQYGMQHTRTFANLCNAGVPPTQFALSLATVCDSNEDKKQVLSVVE